MIIEEALFSFLQHLSESEEEEQRDMASSSLLNLL